MTLSLVVLISAGHKKIISKVWQNLCGCCPTAMLAASYVNNKLEKRNQQLSCICIFWFGNLQIEWQGDFFPPLWLLVLCPWGKNVGDADSCRHGFWVR